MGSLCDLILVTGFLGAGKTTLLQTLLGCFPGRQVRLIVNEFGNVGVDGALLQALGASVREIVNGSLFCACRLDQFEAALDEAQQLDTEVLLVETSGLSDPTAIRTLLEQGGRYPRIRYRGCIALADATRLHRVIDTARVCHRQLSVADLIVLTKTDIATPEQADAAEALLRERYPGVAVVRAVKGALPCALVEGLSTVRPAMEADHARDLTLQKHCVAIAPAMGADSLRAFLRMLAEDTHRIKGVVRLSEGVFLVDCVGAYVQVNPCEAQETDNRLALLAGAGMPLRARLKEALAWYEGLAWEVDGDA